MLAFKFRFLFFAVFLFLLAEGFLFSQVSLKSDEEEYFDFLSLTGECKRSFSGYRTLSDSVWNIEDHSKSSSIWNNNSIFKKYNLYKKENPSDSFFLKGVKEALDIYAYEPEVFSSYNSAFPYGYYDKSLWQGKGFNAAASLGVRFEGYGIEATFKPQIVFSQNKDFEILDGKYGSEWSYFWGQPGDSASAAIDLPQRFGSSSFWDFDWGESEIRYSWHTLTLGFGFQNPWLGTSYLNPMLGSNNAASYPKFDLGFRKTRLVIPFLDFDAGYIEARFWIGRLEESDYFDEKDGNNYRMLNAFSFSYEPSFIDGLTLGVNRIFLSTWKSSNLKYIPRLFTLSGGNDTTGDGEDQKVSLFTSWLFPSVGFEFYAEVGIDDYTDKKVSNPFHTAIYTVGLKKALDIPFIKNCKVELIFEFNNFEMSQDFQFQWPYGGYYSHSKIIQGYTNNGEILGAATSYAGNSQYLALRFYYPAGSTMLFFQRHCPDNNYILSKTVGSDLDDTREFRARYKTYVSLGLKQTYFAFNNLKLNAGFIFSVLEYPFYKEKDLTVNLHPEFGIKYLF